MDQFMGCGYAEPETGSLELLIGDMLVLATDGLYRSVDEDILKAILTTDVGLDEKAEALVNASLSAGGADNITVILAERQ